MLVIRTKNFAYTKIPKNTENLFKMVWGALFETFCS